ncbi:hypothetical protein [Raineyella sp. LH-20]|uniref:hypothetical protein n=1 Tax=Raineyella sp. LH-20 TaxID=3081204 RepID=UPI002953EF94|nr:hypothetical protein [Raineyella sp. LH-20]WOP17399.1 hypothetical protein R0146_08900 [Raineyella sp. LH-20]
MTTTETEPSKAETILAALVLEDGQRWGTIAHPWQRDDARAVLAAEPGAPRRHYLLRGRGMSKTSDAAGMALALLLTEAPPRSRSYVYAVDADQAALFADALAGMVARTPGLAGTVEVGARSVTVRGTGASLSIESSDGASAFGVRPWLTVADEISMWPRTANTRRLWSAIVSGQPKVPGSRLVVIGTAGSPTGLGAEVWQAANGSRHWHTSSRPGPSPWWTEEDTAAARESLTAAEYRRLILCEWAEGDDSLTSPEDIEAAIRPGSASLPPRAGLQYVAALDIGTRRDLTALAVGHLEHRTGGRVVIVDRCLYWRPSSGSSGRVELAEVEAATLRLCKEYGVSRLRFDRMQAEQMTANLATGGVRTREFVFSSVGANRLARGLFIALRDRALELPDDPEVRDQFLTTRLIETGPSTVKLQNPPGAHDDIPTVVGMLVADLMERPSGVSSIATPANRRPIDRGDLRANVTAAGRGATGRFDLLRAGGGAAVREARRRSAGGGPSTVIALPGAWDDPNRNKGI